jgi:hypothetical protein
VAWWPLDETSGTTVSDHAALGLNPGTASASIGPGPGNNPRSVTGFVGNGLKFSVGRKVTINNSNLSSSKLNFGTNTSFTIDAWIKGRSAPIVGNLNFSHLGYAVVFDNNGKLRLDMGNGTLVGPPIATNAWTFVAVVVDWNHGMVTLYTSPPSSSPNSLVSVQHPIPSGANASSNLPLSIGGCSGNQNECDTIIDEVEIFNRALEPKELESIVTAGRAGKCKKGMTWIHTSSNAQTGTITVGCSGCDPQNGDTVCTQLRPLLCIYKPTATFPKPPAVSDDQYHLWSGGLVATTLPVAGNTFAHSTDASSYCIAQFLDPGWRVAEFHDGWGWNFQAYGGTVSAPAVPSTRFWVHINDQQAANCWAP